MDNPVIPKVPATPRKAKVSRETKETKISVSLNIDGSGKYDVETGIGFLDHMLEGFSKHALIDLKVRCKGDLHIDGHHTTEDVGIVMGQAFAEAMGDCAGIRRYGYSYIAMDETLSRAALDISKRPYLIWKVEFSRDKLGDMDTELFREWFHAFAMNGGITLHIENLYGENNHHIVESCYKALARALRDAVAVDPREGGASPSTKGSLGS